MNEAFAQLRKESLDLFNRLRSIEEDLKFVNQVYGHYPDLPLLPNLRCGAWYTDPSLAAPHPVYFKSTDGHFLNWSFNLRRPNLHLLTAQYKGMILVDSTRSGKRIPDALSKTVPIWCSVINRAVLLRYTNKSREDWDVALYTPPGVVSAQEHSQILPLLDGWAKSLHVFIARHFDCFHLTSYTGVFVFFPKLRETTSACQCFAFSLLRALTLSPSSYRTHQIWITPSSTSFPNFHPVDTPFFPIICISASRQVEVGSDRRGRGFVYIQGSGDDHELWGMASLTAHSPSFEHSYITALPGLEPGHVLAKPPTHLIRRSGADRRGCQVNRNQLPKTGFNPQAVCYRQSGWTYSPMFNVRFDRAYIRQISHHGR
ncbi:hypothetical protein D9757_006163 [Collybiopsis confluens]|uniref:Rit1 N-terminal domain-containing protein n=1 Tax=Collybiopsis confluens TaxID=2823264 RepID=A0A8H5HHJ4_9AGAR|nr:hypothetical protein D9757_006163 [Collybiopsis confluens]